MHVYIYIYIYTHQYMFDLFYYRRISWEFQVADIAERLAVLGISLAPLFFKVLSLGSWTRGSAASRCPCPMASHGMADGDAKLIQLIRIRSGWGVDFKWIEKVICYHLLSGILT